MAENVPDLQGHDRYWRLLEICDVLARARNVPALFEELAPRILQLTDCDFLNFSLHDPRRNCMLTHYWKRNQERGKFDVVAVDECLSGWVWKHQQATAIPDVEKESRFPECMRVLRKHGVRSHTMLPMSTAGHYFGAVGLGKAVPAVLDFEDVELLSRVGRMVAFALEKERASCAFEEQQSLAAISRELSSSLELDKLLPVILSSVRSIARYDRALLSLMDEDGKHLRIYGDALEWEPLANHGTVVPLEQALSARAIQTGKVVFFAVAELRDMKGPLAKLMCETGIQSVCSVPLIAGNRVWGALNMSSTMENAFAPSEVEYLQQVANHMATALQNAHAYEEITQLKERLAQERRYLENEIRSEGRSPEIVGRSPVLKRVLDYAAIVATTDSTVLITGETGTGKEQVARAIHDLSRRKDCNFIKLNCAAIPTGLLESELFGHEKGAFTGAVSQKLGRLELADKGTLFLDEIGEIPLELQPKLLRVLQDQEFERLGGTRTIRVDVRLIAATNRDLARAVEERQFRRDLFYRLQVFPLHLPALRERREDIPLLVRHFVEKCGARMNRRIEFIPDEAIEAMLKWKWPGNVRELENFIERSVILSDSNVLRSPLAELRQEISRSLTDSEGTLRDKEREHIVEILRRTGGVLSGPAGAAALLGLKRTTLQYKMQKLGISRMDYLS